MSVPPSTVQRKRSCNGLVNLFLAVTCLLVGLTGNLFAQTAPEDLDWVPKEDMTPEQLADCPVACDGAYISPLANYVGSDQDPQVSELQAEADAIDIDQITSTIVASGNVNVTNGWRQFRADRADIDQESGTYNVSGNIQLREPGLLILGESATVDRNNDSIRLTEGELVLYEERAHVQAEVIRRDPNGEIFIDNSN